MLSIDDCALLIGSPAPVLTYGALNGLLFVSYSQALQWLQASRQASTNSLLSYWVAGTIGGLATWVVSAPTEVVKCRAQVGDGKSSFGIVADIWRKNGVRGFYHGGGVTSIRDAVGYGF